MDPAEIAKRLSRLSIAERQVLEEFCKGFRYIDIGENLGGYKEGTIKTHMSNVFTKLELSEFSKKERRAILMEEFCPVLNSGNLDTPPPEPEIEVVEPISEEMEEEIEDLQSSIGNDDAGYTRSEAPSEERGRRGIRTLGVGVIFGLTLAVCLVAGGWWLLNSAGFEFGDSLTDEPTQEIVASIPTDTISIAPETEQQEMTTLLPSPTVAEIVPTNTLAPTEPSPPIPVIPLPFKDTFDQGPSPSWETYLGSWRMVDGMFTADLSNDWSITFVGDLGWINYAVDVDISSYNRRPIRILVRVQDNNTYLAFETGYELSQTGSNWILVNGGEATTIADGDEGGLNGGTVGYMKTHLRIEVQGNIFSAFGDGKLLLRVQDNTLEWGKVGLAVLDSLEQTTRFDNFVVSQLP